MFLYRHGGAQRRVMHLCGFDPWTGQPTMQPLCGIQIGLDTAINVPLGQPRCKRCVARLP